MMNATKETNAVKVCVRVRPMLPREKLEGGMNCIRTEGTTKVVIGKNREFCVDTVCDASVGQRELYGSKGGVSLLVDRVFKGFNSTVICYGQTGSGKTYTMGMSGSTVTTTNAHSKSSYPGEQISNQDRDGILPRALTSVFEKIEEIQQSSKTRCSVRATFLEIYKEGVRDLLGESSPKIPINLRENREGQISVVGAKSQVVTTLGEVFRVLEDGCVRRTTGATNMNDRSSRSHAIFTLVVEQYTRQSNRSIVNEADANSKETPSMHTLLRSKFHFVDLAGSERAKRTGANGVRFVESVNINRGLLALGKVITALRDSTRRQRKGIVSAPLRHVPYRDSKLTRLLRDSLGGNAHTIFIACVSPADTSFEETLNTLKYAGRARFIKNRAVVNRKAQHSFVVKGLRDEIVRLQECLDARSDGRALSENDERRLCLERALGALRTSANDLEAIARLAQSHREDESNECDYRDVLETLYRRAHEATRRANTALRECGPTTSSDREKDEIVCENDDPDSASSKPTPKEDLVSFQDVEMLRKELDAAREDLRRDEVIFQRKNAERRSLHEKLLAAISENKKLKDSIGLSAFARKEKACDDDYDNDVEPISGVLCRPSSAARVRTVEFDLTAKTNTTNGALEFGTLDDRNAWNWNDDDENGDDISIVASSTVKYDYDDGDESVAPSMYETKKFAEVTNERNLRQRPVTAPATVRDAAGTEGTLVLNRTFERFGEISEGNLLRSSIAHARRSRAKATERKMECVRSLKTVLANKKRETKLGEGAVFSSSVAELEGRIDAADAEIEFNELAIEEAEARLDELSTTSIEDLVRSLSQHELRACAVVFARNVLEMRRQSCEQARRVSDLEHRMNEETARCGQLQKALERSEESSRATCQMEVARAKAQFESETREASAKFEAMARDNLFYRQTHRELKRKVRALSAKVLAGRKTPAAATKNDLPSPRLVSAESKA